MHFVVVREFPNPVLEGVWRDFLSRADRPSHYDTPEYFLEPYWKGKKPFAVLAFDGARVTGVLTGIHTGNSVMCGLESRPQICLCRDAAPEVSRELVKGLRTEAVSASLLTVYAWSWTELPGFEELGFRKHELEGNVVLDLSVGKDALFKNFHASRRRNVRQAIKNGIEIAEEQTPEDLAAYWSVYSAWRQTTRKEIHHNRSFEEIEVIHNLRLNHRRFLAKYNGKVIAATGLRFCSQGIVENANNCSLDEFIDLRPNDLLTWRTIEWACDQGFSTYSLGAAHPFHRRSGGTVVPVCRYRLDRSFLRRYEMKERAANVARSLKRRVLTHLKA